MQETGEILLEVKDLYTNFYTYQGVVRALDGVSFKVKKGETLGLVGETGCGKSVTANCIMRLIPIPPGKIESGYVYLLMPEEVRERMNALEEKVHALNGGNPSAKPGGASSEDMNELKKIQNEYNLLTKRPEYMRKIRGKYISMIFQEPMSALNPVFTSGYQIAEVLLLHEKTHLAQKALDVMDADWKSKDIGYRKQFSISWRRGFIKKMVKDPESLSLRIAAKVPFLRRFENPVKAEATRRAEDMLRLVRIPDPKNVINSYPHELSGGMQQRVMIAMALACKPMMLIADEPTTALDVTIQAQILKLMKDLQEETGTSILLITHNLGVVAETCQRVGVMYAGVMAEIGPVHSIFKEPLHPYTKGLMKAIPKVTKSDERLESIEGNVPNLVTPPPGCRFNPRCPFKMQICVEKKPVMREVKPEHFVTCHLFDKGVSQ